MQFRKTNQILDSNETARLKKLKSYDILDTGPEKAYDDIVKIASKICEVPISLISLIDDKRQWFKSKVGVDVNETPREHAFCAHAVKSHEALIINDAAQDARFANNPLVLSSPHIKFYAGIPLITPDGFALGTLCVIDTVVRKLNDLQFEVLKTLASQIVAQLELRHMNQELTGLLQKYSEQEKLASMNSSRISRIIENIRKGILALDANDNVILINSEFLKLFEISETIESVTGTALSSLIHAIDNRILNSENPFQIANNDVDINRPKLNKIIRLKNNTILEVDSIPFISGDQNIGMIYVASDITEKIHLDELVEKQKMQIAETSKLTALGEMAGNLAHEINNPLAIIIAKTTYMSEYAKKNGNVNAEFVVENINKIRSVVERITKIVKGLRNFARNTEGDTIETASVKEILNDTLEFCSEKFRKHGVQLLTEGIDETVKAKCRPVQVSQILLNLLNNAYDAIENLNERWVRIETNVDEKTVEIRVTDSGSGISFEMQKKIFDPFFTTKPVGKGTGLGLSVSKGIAQSQDGELRIDNETSNTCFVLSLPKS